MMINLGKALRSPTKTILGRDQRFFAVVLTKMDWGKVGT